MSVALLGKSPFFSNLDQQTLQSILQAATPYQIQRGGFLFHQGESAASFYVVIEGRMRLSQIADDGRQVIFHYFGPGDVMGIVVVLSGVVYPVSAEALVDSVTLGWNRETAVELMELYPRLAINALAIVAGRFWELQNRYRELATERVEQRLARVVLRLSDYAGVQAISGAAPTLKLSRQDLAEMTGTTLFSVSRICRDWEQRGILSTGREQITLIDKEQLEIIAEDLQTDS